MKKIRLMELAGLNHLIKEDILELKQMAKQLYSFFKSKGMPVKLPETEQGDPTDRGNFDTKLDLSYEVQFKIFEGDEMCLIALPAPAAVMAMTGVKKPGDLNASKEADKYGRNTDEYYDNPQVQEYVNKLGEEVVGQLKAKYPKMHHDFVRDKQRMFYFMRFGFKQTAKGGDIKEMEGLNESTSLQLTPEEAQKLKYWVEQKLNDWKDSPGFWAEHIVAFENILKKMK